MSRATRPLVIVQCDAFDHALTRQWMDEGALPVMAGMRARGVEASLAGPEQVAELGTALSMYSGVPRSRHGYYAYRQLRPASYDLYPATAADAGVVPLWASVTDASVLVIDAGEAIPVDGLDGVQLTNWTAHQSATRVLPPVGIPSTALAETRRLFGPAPRILEFERESAPAADRAILRTLLDRVRRKGMLGRHFLRSDTDLVVVGFFEAHTAAHRFWKYHRGRVPDAELAVALRSLYAAIDGEIGALLEQIPDANVVLVSLYGMRDEYPTEGLMESFCRVLGYQAAPSTGGARSGSLFERAAAAVPGSVRSAISRHLPPALQERRLADAFRGSTDWARTVAFSIPSLYTGHIRLNVRGREPAGIVEPGSAYRELIDDIEANLHELEDPVTRSPVIRTVHRTADLMGEDAPLVLPDLFIEWEPSAHFRDRVTHPRGTLHQTPPAYFRDSFHSLDGFLLAAGPDVASGVGLPAIDVLDLAPTFLSLLDRPTPPSMTGSIVRALADGGAR